MTVIANIIAILNKCSIREKGNMGKYNMGGQKPQWRPKSIIFNWVGKNRTEQTLIILMREAVSHIGILKELLSISSLKNK